MDGRGRTWISVSTRQQPRQRAWRPDVADGFVVLVDGAGARIVADGLQYTNEVRPDPSGRWLYVVETFGRRLTRFPLAGDGSLGAREAVVTLGHGSFPDGLAFDEHDGVWLTSLVSNRLLRFDRQGHVETVLEDVNAAFVDDAERAFARGTMEKRHLGRIDGTRLQQLTSLAFGGPDRRTVYLGSLHGQCLYRFRGGFTGAAAVHAGFAAP
jgi:sugar lactone lactonase YvrE